MPIETIKRKQWNVSAVQIISDYSGPLSSLLCKCSSIVIPPAYLQAIRDFSLNIPRANEAIHCDFIHILGYDE
jgi:hypothetical protein